MHKRYIVVDMDEEIVMVENTVAVGDIVVIENTVAVAGTVIVVGTVTVVDTVMVVGTVMIVSIVMVENTHTETIWAFVVTSKRTGAVGIEVHSEHEGTS
jgi:hypothetical protein